MGEFIDLTGQKFGRYTVIERVENTKDGRSRWRCLCECGNERIVSGKSLRYGYSKSCGCLQKDTTSKLFSKHHMKHTVLYYRWIDMKDRCNNPNDKCYKYYGGRGIKVCEEWANDFATFAKWAHEHGFDESLTIDRIDPNKNYEPDNCRRITLADQQRNKRNNVYCEINGVKKNLYELEQEYGLSRNLIYNRICTGWPVMAAITAPKCTKCKQWLQEHPEYDDGGKKCYVIKNSAN